MFTQLLVILIVTLSVMFIKYLYYAIKHNKCVDIKVFLKDGTNDKFKEIMKDIYLEHGIEVKEMRDNTLTISILTHLLLICGISFPSIAFMVYNESLEVSFKIIIVIISIVLLLLSIYSYTYEKRYYKKYNEGYKKKILNNYIRKMNNSFVYDMNSTISRETFEKLGLNGEIIDYSGRDHLTGIIDGKKNLNLSKLYVKYIDNSKVKVFSGIFAYISTDKLDKVKIMESTSRTTKLKNIVLQANEDFDKSYVVISEDDSFRLSHEVIRYMLDFRNKYDIDVEIVIKDSKIYVKVACGDIFEPRLYKYNENKDRLWAFFIITKYIIELTDMLKK